MTPEQARRPGLMPVQLHLGGTERVEPLFLLPPADRGGFNAKPSGGFWTSTWRGAEGSSWVQWCLGESYGISQRERRSAYPNLLVPRADARVYEINSYADLEWLVRRYPYQGGDDAIRSIAYPDLKFPSWEAVARDFDAVNLTDAGQWATRLSDPLNLYGWDCESTLWLRWCFADVVQLPPQRWEPEPDAWWVERLDDAQLDDPDAVGPEVIDGTVVEERLALEAGDRT